jgi:chaperonin GroEL (HSP60 family)
LGCRFILDKKIGVGQPKRIENAKILVANTAMDTDKVKIYGARVRVDAMSKVAEIEAAEKSKMKNKVEKIVAHGINCFVNRQLIYNYPEELFADAGVMAIEHADFDGIERLALVTGGEITSTFNDPENVKLGHCKLIEEIMIGEDRLIHFSGVALGQACTIVLRGARSVSVALVLRCCPAGGVRNSRDQLRRWTRVGFVFLGAASGRSLLGLWKLLGGGCRRGWCILLKTGSPLISCGCR